MVDALVDAAFAGRLSELIEPPAGFCFSAFAEFERCPLAYALKYLCGLEPAEPNAAYAFGSAAHQAFELFTRARRERLAAGEPALTREDLGRCFGEAWEEAEFPSPEVKAAWRPRVEPMLDAFWAAEQSRPRATIGEETTFRMVVELADGEPVELSGIIDRLDRNPDGSLELLDYKTGPAWGRTRGYDLQLEIYALGCRDALDVGTPRRALLHFVEHGLFAVRRLDDARVDATRAEVARRAAAIRASDFRPTPSPAACRWCDFRSVCPSRADGQGAVSSSATNGSQG